LSFLAARFSFRFFWAAFLEALPPPLSLLAMRAIYRLKEERAGHWNAPHHKRSRRPSGPVSRFVALFREGKKTLPTGCWAIRPLIMLPSR
jgi:hypothetical protein